MAVPMSFGIAHLSPVLPDFMARYPDVSLEIDFDDGIADLVGGGYDLALRISALADSSLLARRLCGVRVLLVASPAYLDARGRPRHPRELAQHSALLYTLSRFGNAWRFHHKRHGDFSISVPAPLRVNNAEALNPAVPSVVSVFAGRIADTGVDPMPIMRACGALLSEQPKAELLWASTREVLNIIQAQECGCAIITVPHDILGKAAKQIGLDPTAVSLDTVKTFSKDATEAGFKL